MAAPRNILVVRLSAMGDVLHALPAVATLKFSFCESQITWAIKPRWAVLLRGNPYVDRVLPLAFPRPAGRFDLAIDFQGLLKSAVAAMAARRVVGFHRELLREKAAAWFYSEQIRSDSRHVVEMNLDLVAAAGAGRRRIEFPVPEYVPEGDLPEGDFILASPFAGWEAKQWPDDRYARLAALLRERFGWPLVLNCSPAERARAEAIRGCLVNVSSVEGLIGATRRARAVVGLDSGPMHLAAALGKPGVALFGPTDPERNGPYGGTFTVLRADSATTTYRRDSAIAPSMYRIEPEQVCDALAAQISRTLVENRR